MGMQQQRRIVYPEDRQEIRNSIKEESNCQIRLMDKGKTFQLFFFSIEIDSFLFRILVHFFPPRYFMSR